MTRPPVAMARRNVSHHGRTSRFLASNRMTTPKGAKTMRPWLRYTLAVLAVLIILVILAAILVPVFSRAREKARMAPMSAGAPPPPGALSSAAREAEAPSDKSAVTQAAADRKIITTGDMTIEVTDLDKAVADLTAMVKRQGGFLANRSVTASEEWRRATFTIRVPAAHFDALHDGARGLGTVRQDNQQGEDVTKQWQDLEARMRIRKTQEQSLLALMRRQGRLSDVLQVSKELWDIREEIERAEGELRYLRDRVTLATLTVNLNEEIPAGVGKIGPWNLGYSILRALKSGLSILRGLLVAVIYIILAGWVIWLPLVLIVWWAKRRSGGRTP